MLIQQNRRHFLRLSSHITALSSARWKNTGPAEKATSKPHDSLGMAVIFKLFAPDRKGPPMVHRLDPTKMTSQRWREWKERQMREVELVRQRFLPERVSILGNDLAAAHFVVYRGGKVRFVGQNHWIAMEPKEKFCLDLPSRYVRGMFLEGIDMSGTNLIVEGLLNLENLSKLRTLILKGCPNVDDWFVDKISGQFKGLEYLDLSDCPNVTEKALSCLYRLENLKTLVLQNTANTRAFELACLLLEEALPNLVIEGVTYIECKSEE